MKKGKQGMLTFVHDGTLNIDKFKPSLYMEDFTIRMFKNLSKISRSSIIV